MTPLRVSRPQTNAMRLIFVSRSSRLKPRPLLKCVRTISPSRTSTLRPCALKRSSMISERVLLPAPERPVNQIVKPVFTMYFSLCMLVTNGTRYGTNTFKCRHRHHYTKMLVPAYQQELERPVVVGWLVPYPSVAGQSVRAHLYLHAHQDHA